MGLEDLKSPVGPTFRVRVDAAKRLSIKEAKHAGLRQFFVPLAGQTSAVMSVHGTTVVGTPSLKPMLKVQAKREDVDDVLVSHPLKKPPEEALKISSNPYGGLASAKKRRSSLDRPDQHKDQSRNVNSAAALDDDDTGNELLAEHRRFGPVKRQRKRDQQPYESV